MFTKKSIGIALAGALALGMSVAAFATPITVGGVTWDPSSPLNLTISAAGFNETFVTPGGSGTLNGYGSVAAINGAPPFPTCLPSVCALTFTFSYNYTASSFLGTQDVFTGGTINLYVNTSGTYNAANPLSADNGTTPWLTMTGNPADFNLNGGGTAVGTLLSTVTTTTNGGISGAGAGYLNATGGVAAPYFDTHTIVGAETLSDFQLTTNFHTNPTCISGNKGYPGALCGTYPLVGNAAITGSSRLAVPEPGELGLLGLGLGVLGLFFWRRRNEAKDRA